VTNNKRSEEEEYEEKEEEEYDYDKLVSIDGINKVTAEMELFDEE
jgi:hypothetical protein